MEGEMEVYMWGYLPGASAQRSPLLSPTIVRKPEGMTWKEVSAGGCGFAMALSDCGKLITWGSTDDLGQSYITCGKHGEIPEPFPLPPEISVVRAAAGWAHCVAVTGGEEVYTWGWKECVPSGELIAGDLCSTEIYENNTPLQDQVMSVDHSESGGESSRRKRGSRKKGKKSGSSRDENISSIPRLVNFKTGLRISSVAAGGRHSLALSDTGHVWGWGYGGEGQLGSGSRIRMTSSPRPVPCLDSQNYVTNNYGNYVTAIACGGRHSVVITDVGAVLAFGWGLHGQCGQGSNEDELSPICVSSLNGIKIESVAAGLWHTVCTSSDGHVFSFGGNQFGQLGTGDEHSQTLPRLLDSPSLEYANAKAVSCGARHTAIITEDNKVFCWGWNKYGQLGLGDSVDRNIPSEVKIEGCVPKTVACGWWHTLLLVEPPN